MSQSEESTASVPPVPAALPPAAPAPSDDPFRVFGIIGFVLSFFAIVNIAALIISIIALVRSKRAGFRNRFALAGTVISSIGVIITIALGSLAGSTLVGAAQTCARLGDGIHVVGSSTYTCTPTSFFVSFGPQAPTRSADNRRWASANSLYAEAVCPTNAAREALYDALNTNDIDQIAPVAASASTEFDAAAEVFLDHSWPTEIEDDIRFLGETSISLADSWGAVSSSADMDAASSVPFPDAQTPFEAAQRIRAELSRHGQEPAAC
ncbi:hypothetical protein ACDF64_16510 [Agromyces sp. MMS24-JH15]|uniref:hypothetical protein n=1 Tax=Agromyces sp. MMS24-JH15 TaxID=3243765 RepID=UPI00374A7A75